MLLIFASEAPSGSPLGKTKYWVGWAISDSEWLIYFYVLNCCKMNRQVTSFFSSLQAEIH